VLAMLRGSYEAGDRSDDRCGAFQGWGLAGQPKARFAAR